MKRYISYSVSVFLALMLFSSCEQESFTLNLAQSNTLTLRFTTGNMESRATVEGEDVLNENFISTLDVFLYPNTADNTVAATKYIHVSSANRNDEYTVTVPLSSDELDELFGENAESGTCRVYAIANRTAALPTTTSIDELKLLVETTSAFTDNADHGTVTQKTAGEKLGRQAYFVMDSDATNNNDGFDVVTLTTEGSNKSISGIVPLYRSASKIGLFVNVKESVTDDSGVTWVSNPEEMQMIFHHGVKSGYIGNDINTYQVQSGDDFSIETERALTASTEINSKTYYTSSAPYYSYPWDWSSQTTDENTPYVTLIIPWKRQDATSYELCRYQVPVNSLASNELPAKRLDRNTYYQMLLNVGILGAFEESETVDLTPSYMVVPWGKETMGTTIKENSYLVVEKNYVVINNLDEISVGYVASHDISIEIISMTQKDISTVFPTDISYNPSSDKLSVNQGTPGTETNSSVSLSPTLLKTCTISKDENNVILSHELVNYGDEGIDLGDRFDLTPYYITVRVSMTVGTLTFTEDIVFVQYPAIYMEPMLNSDHASSTSSSSNYGYVIVNGNNSAGQDGTFGTATITTNKTGYTETVQWVGQVYTTDFSPGDDDAGTKNPNMYVLTLSSFQTNDFLIGDPRTVEYTDVFQEYSTGDLTTGDTDNDGYWDNTNEMKFGSTNNVWANATALYGSTPRRLTYYYATDESEGTQNVIAPKIRFASSHSIPAPVVRSKEMAKRRCASYQEDGYPAGRWRLPTKAEVEFTMGLNQGGLIPHVFSTSLPYWSAHGYFKSDMSFITDTSVSGQGSVRCVYDEWYWGSEQITDKTTFVWGDYPRDSYPPAN